MTQHDINEIFFKE